MFRLLYSEQLTFYNGPFRAINDSSGALLTSSEDERGRRRAEPAVPAPAQCYIKERFLGKIFTNIFLEIIPGYFPRKQYFP